MLEEAVEAELQFGRDLCGEGLPGMNTESMREYLECVADQRLARLGFPPVYGSENPFSFMELQGVQELTNFFERRPSAYQVAVEGTVDLRRGLLGRHVHRTTLRERPFAHVPSRRW